MKDGSSPTRPFAYAGVAAAGLFGLGLAVILNMQLPSDGAVSEVPHVAPTVVASADPTVIPMVREVEPAAPEQAAEAAAPPAEPVHLPPGPEALAVLEGAFETFPTTAPVSPPPSLPLESPPLVLLPENRPTDVGSITPAAPAPRRAEKPVEQKVEKPVRLRPASPRREAKVASPKTEVARREPAQPRRPPPIRSADANPADAQSLPSVLRLAN